MIAPIYQRITGRKRATRQNEGFEAKKKNPSVAGLICGVNQSSPLSRPTDLRQPPRTYDVAGPMVRKTVLCVSNAISSSIFSPLLRCVPYLENGITIGLAVRLECNQAKAQLEYP